MDDCADSVDQLLIIGIFWGNILYYIAITGSASLQDTHFLGKFGGRGSPWACGPLAGSTRGCKLVSGATRTQTAGSIP